MFAPGMKSYVFLAQSPKPLHIHEPPRSKPTSTAGPKISRARPIQIRACGLGSSAGRRPIERNKRCVCLLPGICDVDCKTKKTCQDEQDGDSSQNIVCIKPTNEDSYIT